MIPKAIYDFRRRGIIIHDYKNREIRIDFTKITGYNYIEIENFYCNLILDYIRYCNFNLKLKILTN